MNSAQIRITRKRLLVIMLIIISCIVLLMVRVAYWSVYRGDWLRAQAENQWMRDAVVESKRGAILDRNMYVLAQSAASKTIAVLPQRIAQEGNADIVADALSAILEMDRETVYQKVTDTTKQEIWIKRQISTEEEEALSALELTGVRFIDDIKRFYPNKEFGSQVIGYTTLDGAGQTGIEKRYNTVLSGRSGRQVLETTKDGSGVPNGQELLIEPQDGKNVILTIDEVDQSFLELACKDLYEDQKPQSVQGLVLDVTNGEILAMVNVPGMDLNELPRNDSETLSRLSVNTITASPFAPGGIFGLFTAAASAEAGLDEQKHVCEGVQTIEGEVIVCSKEHGSLNAFSGATEQCLINGALQAQTMGKDALYSSLRNFGFGEKTGIDFATDASGELLQKKYARNADIVLMGTGEDLTVTQIQIASAAAAIINNGIGYVPRLVWGLSNSDGEVIEEYESTQKPAAVMPATSAKIREMMAAEGKSGSYSVVVEGYDVGVFTGTSAVYIDGVLSENKESSTMIAFAPVDQPKYLVMMTATGLEKAPNNRAVCIPYMQDVLAGLLMNEQIAPMQSSAEHAEKVTVPDVVGYSVTDAKAELEGLGFRTLFDGSGTVTSQQPTAGESVLTGSAILLSTDTKASVQSDSQKVRVPDLKGLDMLEARDKVVEAGLEFVALGNGIVQSQSPEAGAMVEPGSKVSAEFELSVGT